MSFLNNSAGRTLVKGVLAVNRLRHRSKGGNANKEGKVMDMADVQVMIDTMASRFNAEAAGDMDAVFQYKLDEGGEYYAAIAEGNCTVAQGEHDDPTVTLSMDSQTFQEVMDGETDGMQAFMTGRIRAEGDIMLATKLTALFPVGS